MARTLFIDAGSGVSGDMLAGALLHLGVSADRLRDALGKLPWSGFEIEPRPVERSGLGGIQFVVRAPDQKDHRHLSGICRGIEQSELADRVKRRAIDIFTRMGAAEAAVHNVPIEKVHFHEVGAVDSIVDIVAIAFGLEELGVARCICSPIRVGYGTLSIQHGEYPIPAPATLRLLEGMPTFAGDLPGEFTTPTGAAAIASICSEFSNQPLMQIVGAGYGAGSRQYEHFPNMLRLVLGQTGVADALAPIEEVVLLEANLDDMNPQNYDYLFERLYSAGALEVWLAPISMKKNRPAALLSVLAPPALRQALAREMLEHSSSLGVRFESRSRYALPRETVEVETAYGKVHIKRARLGDKVSHFWPEYEDCRRLAEAKSAPLKMVQAEALRAYLDKYGETRE
ncbi:MAG: nickel pincer cofactor biosynthesis protein LarC [Acidobacteriota bacterium]